MFAVLSLITLGVAAIEAFPEVRPVVPMLDGRIVGGQGTTIQKHPHQLSLRYVERHVCGASILSANRALTAAHCTKNFATAFLSVRAGSTYKSQGGQVVDVAEVKEHPNYNFKTADNDVSVLILESDLVLGPKIKPIALQDIGVEMDVGASAVVAGWGRTCSGSGCSTSDFLLEVDLPRISDDKCREAYGDKKITPHMVCYGHAKGGKDACQGDSGGPLVAGGKQVGIVSWGTGCADSEHPGVFTKISNKDIHEHITQNS